MIPENLSAFGTAMANHLWQSTLFAIWLAVSSLALRKNQARVRHHLWLAASFKFLVPFSLLMSLGSHLARLHGSAESQPVFYFVLQTVSQPFHQAWLPGPVGCFPAAMVAGDGCDPMAGWFCHRDWSMVGTVAARRWRRSAAGCLFLTGVKWRCFASRKVCRNSVADFVRSSQSSLEPGIFGILRPLLLWPAGISNNCRMRTWRLSSPMKCSMYGGATTSPPRCTWWWKPSSGFTRWFGGWERGWLRNASGLAMKKCCGWAIRRRSTRKAF